METKIIKIDESDIDLEKISIASQIIKNGGLVAMPTETVYGLGVDAMNIDALKKVYIAKGRPSDNPLIVHIAKLNDIEKLARYVPDYAYILFEKFWPGALTVVLRKQAYINDIVTAGLDTVAIRMPSHNIALELIRKSGCYIAAPSANLSGKPSPTMAKHVIDDLMGRIDCIIEADASNVGLESTVVDLSSETPVLLRPGAITYEQLKEILPNIIIDKHILDLLLPMDNSEVRSPGMKYKHYAPNASVCVVVGKAENVKSKINELVNKAKLQGKKVGVIKYFPCETDYKADVIFSSGDNLISFAKNLFSNLRKLDDEAVDIIFVEFEEKDGLGLAVANRLYKSAGNNVIKV